MVRRVAGTVAAVSAITANAFLIPPGVKSLDDSLEASVVNPSWQAVKLPCPECVLPTPQTEIKEESDDLDAPFFAMGGANSLLVNISTIFDGKALGLPDGYPLYPPLASFKKGQVDMIPSDMEMTSQEGRHTVKVTADTMLSREEPAKNGNTLIRVKYHIVSIDNHPVTVDGLDISCIKTADDNLLLVSVDTISRPFSHPVLGSLRPPFAEVDEEEPEHPAPPPPPPAKRPCHMPAMLCEWRDIIEGKLSSFSHAMPKGFGKPCPGRKGMGEKGHHRGPKGHKGHPGMAPWVDDEGVTHLPSHVRPPHHMGRPGHKGHKDHKDRPHHPHHGHHGHRHHHSAVGVALHRVAMVLMPILVGISMGMFVSFLGMLVGRLIVFVWVRFVRGGQRGYASVRLSEEEAEQAEANKEHFEEDLPAYEVAPAYEEKEVK